MKIANNQKDLVSMIESAAKTRGAYADYNSTDVRFKQTSFQKYTYPSAKARYACIADHLAFGGNAPDDKAEKLIVAIRLKKNSVCPVRFVKPASR